MRQMPKVMVLGDGILGFSCALALSVCGFRVQLAGRHGLWDSEVLDRGLIASAFPAASVLAHSVGDLEITQDDASQAEKIFRHFELLHGSPLARTQIHYELFDSEPGRSGTLGSVPVSEFSPGERSLVATAFGLPAEGLFGWRLKILFVEYPRYVGVLTGVVQRLGIARLKCQIDQDFMRDQPVDVFVNCLGAEASSLLDDDELPNGLLAGLLFYDSGNSVHGYKGAFPLCSYNGTFASGPCAHHNPDGSMTDLYCYPRTDCVVLGGTRQSVPVGGQREFIEAVTGNAAAEVGREAFSAYEEAFLARHRRVLEGLYGMQLSSSLRRAIGFRPVRMGQERVGGPRVALADFRGVPLVHCYGFGGAGLTLSWWAAAQVADRVCRAVGDQAPGAKDEGSWLARIANEIKNLGAQPGSGAESAAIHPPS